MAEGTKDTTLVDRAASAVFERFPKDSWRVQPLGDVCREAVNGALRGRPLGRVLELHSPFDTPDGQVICLTCSTAPGTAPEHRVIYPCATMKAVYG